MFYVFIWLIWQAGHQPLHGVNDFLFFGPSFEPYTKCNNEVN